MSSLLDVRVQDVDARHKGEHDETGSARTYPRAATSCLSCTRPIRPGGFARHRGPEGIAGFALGDRCGSVRCGGSDFAQAEQAGLRPCRASKRNGPQKIPVRGAGQHEVVAVRHNRHRLDIGTQPSTANATRLRASPGCSRSPKTPQAEPGRGFRCYWSLTETLSLAPVASITDIRMKPLPGGCHCVSRRRCGSVTGVPSTSQV